MTVGILIITHNNIGDALLHSAVSTMGGVCPLHIKTLSVTNSGDRDALQQKAEQMVLDLNTGMGVLVMTDIYGSTPGNIATSLANDEAINVLAGVNLPMLIKVFNYPQLDLISMMNKALIGAQESIIMCKLEDHQTESS